MQVLPALNSGGVERGVVDVAKEVFGCGFGSIVVSNGGQMVSQFDGCGVNHIQLPLATKNPFVIYQNSKKLAEIIKKYRVDLVHIRSRAPGWSSYLACRKTGCKIISTIHGPYSMNLFTKAVSRWKMFYNSVMVKPQFIIVVSEFIKRYVFENYSTIEDLNNKQIEVIHRGVDVDYFDESKVDRSRVKNLIEKWRLPKNKQIIMLPGRVTGWKGHEFLISSLSKVRGDNFLCVMVGSAKSGGSFMKRLERKIKYNGLKDKVRIFGKEDDMPAVYLAADVVVSASIKPEAFGRVSVEAGAMGRVVISTNIGGSLETVIDGETGFLVGVGDEEKMAEIISRVLTMSKSEKKKIGKSASSHVGKNFSNKKMLRSTIEFYQRILNPNSSLETYTNSLSIH